MIAAHKHRRHALAVELGRTGVLRVLEQASILGQMQELIYEDPPICTLFYAPNYTAYSNNLNGLYWDSDTACYYSSAWLSE